MTNINAGIYEVGESSHTGRVHLLHHFNCSYKQHRHFLNK